MRKENQFNDIYWANYNSPFDFVIYIANERRENHLFSEVLGPFTSIKNLKKALLPKLREERDLIVEQINKVNTLRNEDIK